MPPMLNRSTVLRRLSDLDRQDRRRRVFGADSQEYRLKPPLPVSVIQAFEDRHGVSLPEDYRLFLTEIGNGGVGPYSGLLPFGKDDDDRDWEGGGLVGDSGRLEKVRCTTATRPVPSRSRNSTSSVPSRLPIAATGRPKSGCPSLSSRRSSASKKAANSGPKSSTLHHGSNHSTVSPRYLGHRLNSTTTAEAIPRAVEPPYLPIRRVARRHVAGSI